MGELEARKLKYPTTGTEAILMGILVEGLSFPPHLYIYIFSGFSSLRLSGFLVNIYPLCWLKDESSVIQLWTEKKVLNFGLERALA